MLLIFLILIGYILGSIPFGYIIGKIAGVDVTKTGSKNIGATNVVRVLGKKFGVPVFILDFLKGTFAVLLASTYTNDPLYIIIVGFSAILGHMFSVFMKFKGGKGSATGLGVLVAITPDVFFFGALIVILTIIITRYVSVGSMVGTFCVFVLMILLQKPLPYVLATLFMFLFSVVKHKANIQRLIAGTENKIGEKK